MVNFNDIADKKVADVERPPLLPIGTYIVVVEKHPETDNVGNGRFDTVDFVLKVVNATDDVDEESLQEYGDITQARVRNRFMFDTEDETKAKRSLYNLRRFMEDHLQIDGVEGMTIKEALSQAVGHQCLAEIKWRMDRDNPEIQYAEIKRTAPVD